MACAGALQKRHPGLFGSTGRLLRSVAPVRQGALPASTAHTPCRLNSLVPRTHSATAWALRPHRLRDIVSVLATNVAPLRTVRAHTTPRRPPRTSAASLLGHRGQHPIAAMTGPGENKRHLPAQNGRSFPALSLRYVRSHPHGRNIVPVPIVQTAHTLSNPMSSPDLNVRPSH